MQVHRNNIISSFQLIRVSGKGFTGRVRPSKAVLAELNQETEAKEKLTKATLLQGSESDFNGGSSTFDDNGDSDVFCGSNYDDDIDNDGVMEVPPIMSGWNEYHADTAEDEDDNEDDFHPGT